jgi:hypothetical protein
VGDEGVIIENASEFVPYTSQIKGKWLYISLTKKKRERILDLRKRYLNISDLVYRIGCDVYLYVDEFVIVIDGVVGANEWVVVKDVIVDETDNTIRIDVGVYRDDS